MNVPRSDKMFLQEHNVATIVAAQFRHDRQVNESKRVKIEQAVG